MKECEHKNIADAIRVGRAQYICPDCKTDVSVMYFFFMEAILKDTPTTTE